MELIIKNLSKTYSNGVKALNDISLTIPQGMFGLLGPNGAGKSTLMRTIATLQDADFGTISLDGIDVLKDKQSVRERLGYLPQDFGLYPRINAETMLDHIAQMKGIGNKSERKELVQSLLQKVKVEIEGNISNIPTTFRPATSPPSVTSPVIPTRTTKRV